MWGSGALEPAQRNEPVVERVANRTDGGLPRVELGNDDELRRLAIRQRTAAAAQDCYRVAAMSQPARVLVKDGFDAADDGRAGVVQEPNARVRAQPLS